jgi:hypothetical protein
MKPSPGACLAAAADAIAANPELRLAMADYDIQFGGMDPQFISYLAGNAEKLQGGTVQAGNPPTRGDVQNTSMPPSTASVAGRGDQPR